MWRLFPQFRGFRASLGISVLAYGILALPLLFLGYAYGVAFFGLFCLYPAVAGLVGFSCGPPLWWSLWCVGIFLKRRSCIFFLSSCSAWGRLLLRLFWCCFCASSCGACGFPRRVLRQVTLRGSATFLAPVACPAPAVELCCWVCGVFGAPLGFLPCAVLFLWGLRFVQLTLLQVSLGGFLPFLSTGA